MKVPPDPNEDFQLGTFWTNRINIFDISNHDITFCSICLKQIHTLEYRLLNIVFGNYFI